MTHLSSLIQLFFLSSLLSAPPERAFGPRTSLVAVLAKLSDYDGRRVTVEGWCFRGQEESALYLTRDDAEFANESSALWLEMEARTLPELKANSALRCSVEGRVDTKRHGHLDVYPATLTDISHASRMRSRAEYNRPSTEKPR